MKRLYIMDCGDFVKVGISKNVENRIRQIPYQVFQYYATKPIDNAENMERIMHNLLSEKRKTDIKEVEYFNVPFDEAMALYKNISVFMKITKLQVQSKNENMKERITYIQYAKRRDELGLTDYKVAQMSGVLTATLSEWKNHYESGGTRGYQPKLEKLTAIAAALDMKVTELID